MLREFLSRGKGCSQEIFEGEVFAAIVRRPGAGGGDTSGIPASVASRSRGEGDAGVLLSPSGEAGSPGTVPVEILIGVMPWNLPCPREFFPFLPVHPCKSRCLPGREASTLSRCKVQSIKCSHAWLTKYSGTVHDRLIDQPVSDLPVEDLLRRAQERSQIIPGSPHSLPAVLLPDEPGVTSLTYARPGTS
mgnify:FL=1